MTNLARPTQSLVLRALLVGTKSCALVNVFMIYPRVGWRLTDKSQILPLITAISWLSQILPLITAISWLSNPAMVLAAQCLSRDPLVPY
jgi:hypothetical protein